MLRCTLAITALLGIATLTASPASAYEGPWCATVFNGEGAVKEICHFRTIAECIAEVTGGNRGQCGNNPRYVGSQSSEPSGGAAKTRRQRH